MALSGGDATSPRINWLIGGAAIGAFAIFVVTDADVFWACILFPLAALLYVLPWLLHGDDNAPGPYQESARMPSVDTGSYQLAVAGKHPIALQVEDAEMESFEATVSRVYEVGEGIYCGEFGGDAIDGWPPKAFPDALKAVRQKVAGIRHGANGQTLHEPIDDIMLAQRLIASNLDVSGAARLVQEYVDYRREMRGGVAPTLEWIKSGVAVVPFEDCLGRPVVVVRPRHHTPGNLRRFLRGLRATVDAMTVHMLQKRTRRTGGSNLLEQYVLLFDFEGASWSNFDRDALKATITSGTQHYPNKIGQIFVLHVNRAARAVWSIASSLLHPRTRRKVQLLVSADVPGALLRIVPPESRALLPPSWGGDVAAGAKRWPEPTEAVCFEEQVGELAAAVFAQAGVVPEGALPFRRDVVAGAPTQEAKRNGFASSSESTMRALGCGALACCTSGR